MEDHLKNVTFEFVKPKQKKLTAEIIDIDTLPHKSFQNNQQSSSIVCENSERLLFENMLLKEKIELLGEESSKLEEELKYTNDYAGSLKNRLLS